jgi:hypothetical protein
MDWRRVEHLIRVNEGRGVLRVARMLRLALPTVKPSEQNSEWLTGVADTIGHHLLFAARRSEKLAQSILAKVFRGALVPTEAELARREGREYEPASELLERIKAGMLTQTTAPAPKRN